MDTTFDINGSGPDGYVTYDAQGNPVPMGAFGAPRTPGGPVGAFGPPMYEGGGGGLPNVKPTMITQPTDTSNLTGAGVNNPAMQQMLKAMNSPDEATAIAKIGEAQLGGQQRQQPSGAKALSSIFGNDVGKAGSDFLSAFLPGVGAAIAGGRQPGTSQNTIKAVEDAVNRSDSFQKLDMEGRAKVLQSVGDSLKTLVDRNAQLNAQKAQMATIAGQFSGGPKIAPTIGTPQAATPMGAGSPAISPNAAPASAAVAPDATTPAGSQQAPQPTGGQQTDSGAMRNADGSLNIPGRTSNAMQDQITALSQQKAAYDKIAGINPLAAGQSKALETQIAALQSNKDYEAFGAQRAAEAKRGSDQYDTIMQGRKAADDLAPHVQAFKALVDAANAQGVPTGGLASMKVDAAKILRSAGFKPEDYGLGDGVGYNEALKAVAGNITSDDISALHGSHGAAIVKTLQGTVGGNDTTLAGNKALAAALDTEVTRARSRASLAQEFVNQTGGQLDNRFDDLDGKNLKGFDGVTAQKMTAAVQGEKDVSFQKKIAAMADGPIDGAVLGHPGDMYIKQGKTLTKVQPQAPAPAAPPIDPFTTGQPLP